MDYANDIAGSLRARETRDRVSDTLDSILKMDCPTSACEGYKQVLVQRSVDVLNHLNGVVKDWSSLDQRLELMGGAAVGGRLAAVGPVRSGEALALSRVEKAVEYLKGTKGSRGAIDAGFDTANLQSKLQGYLLDAGHPQNQTKATWFQQALGFDKNNWEGLASQIQFNEAKAVVTKTTQYGQTFEQQIPIVGANGRAIDVPFVFLKDGSGTVRLVTGIPAKK